MGPVSKPLVLVGCTPIYGHIFPVRVIVKELIERGYEVTWVGSSAHQNVIENVGATFIRLSAAGDWSEADVDTLWPERNNYPPGPLQLAYDTEHIFINSLADQHRGLQTGLKQLMAKHPGRPIVQLNEGAFFGALPISSLEGVPKPTATIGLGIVPVVLSSIDLPPFGPGLPPDSSPEGRIRNQAMTKEMHTGAFAQAQKRFDDIFISLGAKPCGHFFLDAAYLVPDRFFQMCIPSVEYPRSDAPSSLVFAGGLPKGKRDPMPNPPAWWDEVIHNEGKKHIVAVSQGSIALNYSQLTIPVMEAFKDREDILVVVALGKKGATLEGIPIPSNSRVADFIPFDELLPHTSAFISNGGYGAFQHAISNGTPIIIGGDTEDKPEVGARAEWAGVGINLKTSTPTQEQLRVAVDEIIGNKKYKVRVRELEVEMAKYDPISIIAKAIDELGAQ